MAAAGFLWSWLHLQHLQPERPQACTVPLEERSQAGHQGWLSSLCGMSSLAEMQLQLQTMMVGLQTMLVGL